MWPPILMLPTFSRNLCKANYLRVIHRNFADDLQVQGVLKWYGTYTIHENLATSTNPKFLISVLHEVHPPWCLRFCKETHSDREWRTQSTKSRYGLEEIKDDNF